MALDQAGKRVFKVVGTRPPRPDGVDKVTGRALYGADVSAPGMLVGRILRSPHAHAEIRSIDTAAAEALPGVKAVITARDFARVDGDKVIDIGEDASPLRDIMDNCLARDKVLYDGHAVAAVAAVSADVAKAALKLIKVDYAKLPHVIDVDAAMRADAPVVQAGRGYESVPEGMSGNVTSHCEFGHGDLEAGFAKADRIVERSFTTAATHQGYIEPHACLASMTGDGKADLWCCTQGQFNVREICAEHHGHGREPAPRHRLRDRRRLRRQDHGLHRAGRADAVAQDRPPGQDRDDPRRGVPGHRPDGRHVDRREDRHDEGRAHHRGRGASALYRRRLSLCHRRHGRAGRLRRLRPRGGAHLRLERPDQPPEGGRLSRPGRAAGDLCGGERRGRTLPGARSRSAGCAAEERRARGHQGLLRPDLRGHRPRRDAGSREGASALLRAARPKARRAASRSGSGSISAAIPACRSTSTPTAPWASPRAIRTSAARAPRSA